MQTLCSACGSPVGPVARFCDQCGVALPRHSDRDAGDEAVAAHPAPANAERRQLTVVFCDLVGSTALSERLDPEEVRDVMHAYHEACAEVIRHYEGHVAQYLGDGVLTYFGYPHAQEDAAVRAARAALEIVESVGSIPLPGAQNDERLQVRIGIHTGLVVVGDHGASGTAIPLAFGGAPNVAARVQNVALPGMVVVSETTHHLIRHYFDFRTLGSHALKGVAVPVQMHEVLRESGIETRFDASVKTGLIPLVSRRHEIETLVGHWETAKQGKGCVVLVTGDAGIGKSRLLRALQDRIDDDEHAAIQCRCSPYHQNSALHPLLVYLRRSLDFGRDDTPAEKLRKLEGAVAHNQSRHTDTLPLLASLLSLPHPEDLPPLGLTPQARKLRTLEALVGWILDTARRQPVYLELEDLHWSDPSTLELVDLLVDRCTDDRIYFVMSSRDRFLGERWAAQPRFHPVGLQRLDPAEVAELVLQVAGGRPIPREVSRQIVSRTDGVPLFVEELTKMVLESRSMRQEDDGTTSEPTDFAIPATLRDSLMARLDQYPAARQVAQLGATLGREFPLDLLRAISPFDGDTLESGLSILVGADLLLPEGGDDDRLYVFKHALIRDIAYESLLKRKRQQFHQATAQALEKEFADVVETQPEIIAHHFAAAGLRQRAIPFLQSAAHRALGRSAYEESAHHLTRALEMLERLPVSNERSARELELRSTLGVVLTATEGYTSERVEQNHSRAEQICREMDDVPQLFPSLYGLWTYHMLRNHRDMSFDLANRLAALGETRERRYIAASARGASLYWAGELNDADACLLAATELFDPSYQDLLHELLGEDAALLAHLYRGWCLVDLGRFDAARRQLAAIPTDAEGAPSPYVQTTRLVFETLAHLNMGMLDSARELAQEVISRATEHQFPWFLATANCAYGATLVRDGSPKDGVPIIEQGIAFFDAIGTMTPRPYWLCELAKGTLALGRADEALEITDAALLICATGLSQTSAADLHTLRGRCLANRRGDSREPELCFEHAVGVARSQGSPTYELRATRALARLLIEQGRIDEARDRLTHARALFVEGSDVPELTRTDQLIAEIG